MISLLYAAMGALVALAVMLIWAAARLGAHPGRCPHCRGYHASQEEQWDCENSL